MSNLFSVFEPWSFLGMPLKWASVCMGLLYAQSGFWLASSRRSMSTIVGYNEFASNVKPVFSFLNSPGVMFFPFGVFIFLCQNNYWGMSPYFFTASSHLSFCLSMALPLWVGHMLYSILTQPSFMLAHLVPLGTPGVLMPFMVVIELISTFIRPFTLAVRLTANMIAGHLLLVLLSSQAVNSSYLVLLFLMPALVILWLLESAVAVIQAYVFSTLSSLYLSEVNTLCLNKTFWGLK